MTLPDTVRAGPLALAAAAYWRATSTARLCLGVGFAFEAATAAAALLDASEHGPPQIRERARRAAVEHLTSLEALTVSR